MDKYEYKIRAEEIKRLVAEGDFAEAMEICDSIDWRRVKSVMMLCTVSDIYKINRRYEDSKNILLLAYDRHPGGRQIVYSLCELSLKLGELVQAIEYYKEFVSMAPQDSGVEILHYKILESQDTGIGERIDTLKRLKAKEYKEKWAYELAYLYHKNGNVTDCVNECDELILWFGEGKYVRKAMELKMLHAPLTPEQQAKYDLWIGKTGLTHTQNPVHEEAKFTKVLDTPAELQYREQADVGQTASEPVAAEMDIQVKTMDVSQYNTVNLQKALAESMKEFMEEQVVEEAQPQVQAELTEQEKITNAIMAPMLGETRELYSPELYSPELHSQGSEPQELLQQEEVTQEFNNQKAEAVEEAPAADADFTEVFHVEEMKPTVEEIFFEDKTGAMPVLDEVLPQGVKQVIVPKLADAAETAVPNIKSNRVMEEMRKDWAKENGLEHMLSQESDGQISIVVPEAEKVEKQITGQISIEDILAEWERMKKENEQKRAEDVRRHVLEQTGSLFKEFEISSRSGLLEQLDKAAEIAIQEEARAAEEAEAVLPGALGEFALAENSDVEEPDETEMQELSEELEMMEVQEYAEETEAVQNTEEVVEEITEPETTEADDLIEQVEAGDVTDEAEQDIQEPAEEQPEQIIEESVESDVEQESSGIQPEQMTEEKAEGEKAQPDSISLADDFLAGEPEEDFAETEAEEEAEESRMLTDEEKELFGHFIQNKDSKKQILTALDKVSLASYTGNVMITGDEGTNTLTLAKNLIREVQLMDRNFSGRVAKISGTALNGKDIPATLAKLSNGALIVQGAGSMKEETARELCKTLDCENKGIIVILEGTKKAIDRLISQNKELHDCFNARIDIPTLSNDELANFGKKYARQMEYFIDDMGMLALHTRISDMQTSDHAVTIYDVKEIVDEAIDHANGKTIKHFFDILFGKRYDEEDMIILREVDFMSE